MQNNNSGTNTVLIVLVLIILVGVLAWFFSRPASVTPATNEGASLDVDVSLPDGGSQNQ